METDSPIFVHENRDCSIEELVRQAAELRQQLAETVYRTQRSHAVWIQSHTPSPPIGRRTEESSAAI